MRPLQRIRSPITVAAVLVAVSAALSGGCYERTVSAKGFGASSMDVQKPYRSETMADRWTDKLLNTEKKQPESKTRAFGSGVKVKTGV